MVVNRRGRIIQKDACWRGHTHTHTPHLQGDVITPTYSSKEQLIDSGGKSKTVDSSNFKTIWVRGRGGGGGGGCFDLLCTYETIRLWLKLTQHRIQSAASRAAHITASWPKGGNSSDVIFRGNKTHPGMSRTQPRTHTHTHANIFEIRTEEQEQSLTATK